MATALAPTPLTALCDVQPNMAYTVGVSEALLGRQCPEDFWLDFDVAR